MSETFMTPVVQAEDSNATGLRVPAEVVAALGAGKRPKVTVSLNGYSYRSTVAAYGDVFMLPLSAEHRTAAGVKAGDQVQVTIALDLAPRGRGGSGRSGRGARRTAGCDGGLRCLVVYAAQGVRAPGRGSQGGGNP